MPRLAINLHKIAAVTNVVIPLLAALFIFFGVRNSKWYHIGSVVFGGLFLVNVYLMNFQVKYAVLRNFGIIGQLRYMLESIGPEFRQYLYLSDNEERPFNRTEREEVYSKSKNEDSTSSFGSQNEFNEHEIKIRHSMFPSSGYGGYKVVFGEERGISNIYAINKPAMISAMSFGALGESAVRALARGAKKAGIPINTGEGGYPKYHLMEGPNIIFQMGTAKFGVRNEDGSLNEYKLRKLSENPQIKMIEIKFSQGAKPGKGGLLPKEKITGEISSLRRVPMGRDVVSPSHHIECKDAKTTVEFIKRVQDVSQLPVGMKLCLGDESEFTDLVKEMKLQNVFPDYVALDGSQGGTGAAPKSFMDDVGVPLFPALRSVQNILVKGGVRDKMKIVASGKLINPGKQIIALALGADVVYTARGFMLALGCIQALQCNKNTCPVGITTQNPGLQKGLDIEEKAERVKNYAVNLEKEFKEILSATGSKSYKDLNEKKLYIPEIEALAMCE